MSDTPSPPPADGRLASMHRLEDVSPRRALRHRTAYAVRRVIAGLAGTDADEDTLSDLAARFEEAADRLEQFGHHSLHGFSEAANSGDPHSFFDGSPILGRANPLAPPVELQSSDHESVVATAVFGPAYEGPPNCVHGGYIAAAFDDVLGLTQSLSGQHGMTGRLTVSYRSPTPLHEELVFRGVLEGTERRKIFTSGTLHAGDRLCAEAEGLFIAVDFAALEGLDSPE